MQRIKRIASVADKIITKIDKGFIEAAPRYEKKYIHTSPCISPPL